MERWPHITYTVQFVPNPAVFDQFYVRFWLDPYAQQTVKIYATCTINVSMRLLRYLPAVSDELPSVRAEKAASAARIPDFMAL